MINGIVLAYLRIVAGKRAHSELICPGNHSYRKDGAIRAIQIGPAIKIGKGRMITAGAPQEKSSDAIFCAALATMRWLRQGQYPDSE